MIFAGSLEVFQGFSQIPNNPGHPKPSRLSIAASFHLLAHSPPSPHPAGVLRWCHLRSPPRCRKAEFGAPENWEPLGKRWSLAVHGMSRPDFDEIEIYETPKMDDCFT